MRKKFMAGMLAATLAMGMNTAVFAGDNVSDPTSITLDKIYKLTNEKTVNPGEIFSFTGDSVSGDGEVTCYKASDSSEEYNTDPSKAPKIALGTVSYTAGVAAVGGTTEKVNITIPSYDSVGVYEYKFNETDGKTLGVTYFKDTIYVQVTVAYDKDNNLKASATAYTQSGKDKIYSFTNEYSAGSLSITKNVTGNMGDKKKDFDITVTFKNETDCTLSSTIGYTDEDGYTDKISPEEWDGGTFSKKIDLSDGDTFEFTNIPYGVTYTVVENNYADVGYTTTYAGTDVESGVVKGSMNSAKETVTITNNKDKNVDTGINLDSMPYLMMMGVACAGMFTFFTKKRMARED